MADDDTDLVLERLDRLAFLFSLAFRREIEAARAAVATDPVAELILETTAEDWIPAGDLKRAVATATKQSERTVERRVSRLASTGWLRMSGTGPAIRYRANQV